MVFSYIKSKYINFSAFQSLCSKNIVSNGAIIPGLTIASSSLWRTRFARFSDRVVPAICFFGVKHLYSQHHHRLLPGPRRFYHANPYPLYQPLPRAILPLQRKTMALQLWTIMKGHKLLTFMLGSCIVATICFGRIERTPYSRRFHLVLSQRAERKLAEFQWKMFKEQHQAEILPPSDPTGIRVQAIATKIIQALNNGLSLEHECKINGHAPKSVGSIFKDEYQGASLASRFSTSRDFKGNFGSEDGKGIEKSQKQARKLTWKPSTKHLNGKSWEIYVLDSSKVRDSECIFDGRIVVNTSRLQLLGSDEELATVIAHAVGHAVARHWSEFFLKFLWFFTFMMIHFNIAASINPNDLKLAQQLQVLHVFMMYLHRRREAEVDYIGLMLMASAGYDPRQAPKVYGTFNKLGGDLMDNHPSGSQRVELLSKPEVMSEATAIYEEVRSGQGVRSFI